MYAPNWRFLVGLLALVAIAGCTEPSHNPDTVKVTGTVTHNGEAVAGAVVTFSPKGSGNAAHGTTDASGNYTLTSFVSGDGAVVGSYAVAIRKTEGGAAADAGGGGGTESDEDLDAAYGAAQEDISAAESDAETAEAKDLLPAKYKDPKTSELTAEVTEGGANDFPFALTD